MNRDMRADSETLPSPRPSNMTAMRPPPLKDAPASQVDLSSASVEDVLMYALVGHHGPGAMGVLEAAVDSLRTHTEALDYAHAHDDDPQARALWPIVRRLEASVELLRRARG